MTVESELSVSGPYDGNDTTTIFPYQFLVLNEGDLEVVHSDANGLETILEISTHYTVTGVSDPQGGNVTYPVSGDPLPTGEKLIVRRKVDALQEVQLSTQGGYSPKTVETMLDRITMVAQQLKSDLARCISVSAFSDATPDDLLQSINQNALIASNSANTATQKADEASTSASQAVSAAEGIDTADLKAGRKNLLLGNFRVNQREVTGTVVLAAGEYGHDRFRAGASGCSYTFSTTDNITTVDITAGSLEQEIEGVNILSGDYVLSWQGAAQGRINGGAYGDSGEIAATLTGGTNAIVEFGIGTVALPQLEKGTEVTSFEIRPLCQEIYLCQWYFQRLLYAGISEVVAVGAAHASTAARFPIPLLQAMRTAPSVTLSGDSTWNLGGVSGENPATLAVNSATVSSFVVSWTDTGAWNGNTRDAMTLRSDNGAAYWEADAEL